MISSDCFVAVRRADFDDLHETFRAYQDVVAHNYSPAMAGLVLAAVETLLTHGPYLIANNETVVDNPSLRSRISEDGTRHEVYCDNCGWATPPGLDDTGDLISSLARNHRCSTGEGGPHDTVRVTGNTDYIHPVNFFAPPPPPPGQKWTKKGPTNKDRLATLEHRVDHGVTHDELNRILRTLNSIIDVVNRLAAKDTP